MSVEKRRFLTIYSNDLKGNFQHVPPVKYISFLTDLFNRLPVKNYDLIIFIFNRYVKQLLNRFIYMGNSAPRSKILRTAPARW